MPKIFVILILLLTSCSALAANLSAEEQTRREQIASRFPDVKAADVIPAPVPGMYEVLVGPIVLYVSADGRYVMRGNLFDMNTDENLTEQREQAARQSVLRNIDDEELIVFSPEKPAYTVTVFTDTSCSYCRLFHDQIADYNARGIKVRYAAYPRQGMASETWREMENVFCADDRREALTRAKKDMAFEIKACETDAVRRDWQLGRMLGVRGTPAIFTEDGRMIPGYLPPARLAAELAKQ